MGRKRGEEEKDEVEGEVNCGNEAHLRTFNEPASLPVTCLS